MYYIRVTLQFSLLLLQTVSEQLLFKLTKCRHICIALELQSTVDSRGSMAHSATEVGVWNHFLPLELKTKLPTTRPWRSKKWGYGWRVEINVSPRCVCLTPSRQYANIGLFWSKVGPLKRMKGRILKKYNNVCDSLNDTNQTQIV